MLRCALRVYVVSFVTREGHEEHEGHTKDTMFTAFIICCDNSLFLLLAERPFTTLVFTQRHKGAKAQRLNTKQQSPDATVGAIAETTCMRKARCSPRLAIRSLLQADCSFHHSSNLMASVVEESTHHSPLTLFLNPTQQPTGHGPATTEWCCGRRSADARSSLQQ